MRTFVKRNIFLLCSVSLLFLILEIVTSWQALIMTGIGFVILILAMLVQKPFLRQVGIALALFLIVLSLSLTRSIWLLLLAFLLVLIVFRTNEGNEFIVWGESLVHPFDSRQKYHGLQLVTPQSQQRTLLKQQGLIESMDMQQSHYEWDDINLVYFGGDSIIDLGNTLLPEQECIVMIRKGFGRTRIIVPNDIGIRLNISAISGKVMFEANEYTLVGENFRWETSGYLQANRKLRVILSVGFGNVEVILL
ncbi:cell wall-active antibiotics response protein LiaF [Aerococcaceae bacterium NML180378]|nr:cell wall-active antibiotics response protein LiaF [Aerococcaceae bacterium NML180378]MDO4774803.1 cell wall-active antibiotics response protein LiaF [Aerococcaceae bacterium]